MGSTATIDAVAVLDTQPNGNGAMGVGIAVITSYITADPASAEMTHVVVDGAHAGGIVVAGGDLELEDAFVRNVDKQPNVDDFGDGIGAAATIVLLRATCPPRSICGAPPWKVSLEPACRASERASPSATRRSTATASTSTARRSRSTRSASTTRAATAAAAATTSANARS
jgi:hypothetical protein